MKKRPILLLLHILFFLHTSRSTAQKDTAFWFVAPEISQGLYDYDRPVSFWVSTYSLPAVVTLSQPANSNFTPQTINLPANTSGQFTFPPFFDVVENKPPNTILKKGFFIKATAPISAYYEVVGEYKSNPEIFSLKGKNALGTDFLVPFQNIMANSNSYTPTPHAAFDIVATENATNVTITPSTGLFGHSANTPFTISLNKGETYSAQSESLSGAGHPSGSQVKSNKPIAITIKDDLLDSGLQYGGSCRDLAGDQIVPIQRLGHRYIVQKGLLNASEQVFVLATESNTQVKQDGIIQVVLNVGETAVLPVNSVHYIESTAPIYVLQVTGNGCEIGEEIMPPLDCSGSTSIRFVRPTPEPFLLFLSTKTENASGFKVNGSTISANNFLPVPGSNGEFVAGTFELNESIVPTGFSSIVENSLGLFQMGFLNGQENATGCRYGFFSDFGNQIHIKDTVWFCEGESVISHGLTISAPGEFEKIMPSQTGCDTVFLITAQKQQYNFTEKEILFCPGTSVTVGGISYHQPQVVIDTIQSLESCDTIAVYTLVHSNLIHKEKVEKLCPGSTILISGTNYSQPSIVSDTIHSLIGCDTLLTINIKWAELPQVERELTLCHGASIIIGGVTYNQPGIVLDTIQSKGEGCDTIRSTTLLFDMPEHFLIADTVICEGSPITLKSPYSHTYWNGIGPSSTFEITTPGLIIATALNPEGCIRKDSILIKTCCSDKNIYLPNVFSPNDDGYNDEFCVFPTEKCDNLVLKVFSRWGELLFESKDSHTCWDGYFRGKPMPSGVYVWLIDFISDKTMTHDILKGSVTLIR